MKRFFAFLLALTVIASLAACGNGGSATSGQPTDKLIFADRAAFEPGTPEKSLDPQAIYNSLTYTPEMFYGTYRVLGGDDGQKTYAQEMSYVDYQYYNFNHEETVKKITAVPFAFRAGPQNFNHIINYTAGRYFMEAQFLDEQGNLELLKCAYTVKGNTLTLNPLSFYEYIKETNRIRYTLSETVLTYQFQFEGRKLTLSNGKNSVTLHTGLAVYTDDSWVSVENYLADNSARLDNLDYINLYWTTGDKYSDPNYYMSVKDTEGNNQYPYGVMDDKGLITLTMDTNGKTTTRQFVYFYCDNDGIILTDGENTYYYTAGYNDRHSNQLYGSLTIEDMGKLENMSEDKLEQIIETKANLLADLAAAFQEAGISVSINEQTGEITMDSAVLFPVGEYTVSEDGKALLESFITVYTSVVFDEKYEGFLSKIMVEGHTDSTGNYDNNLTLSQNRADSVKTLCLEYGGDYTSQLTDMLQAVGYSSDNLIFDASGAEDQAASRRVCFRFIINLEN